MTKLADMLLIIILIKIKITTIIISKNNYYGSDMILIRKFVKLRSKIRKNSRIFYKFKIHKSS